MFGRKEDRMENTGERTVRSGRWIELEGAICEKEDDQLTYMPRGKISINLDRVAGYYDHTILIDGYKIRVMDSYAQIALKVLEAEK